MIDDSQPPPSAPPEQVAAPNASRRGGWRAAMGRVGALGDATTVVLLALIVVGGFYLRTVGIDWDAGNHLHPDERFLTDVSSSLSMPADLLNYLDTDTSPLNPRNKGKQFFSYGTWPITIARVAAEAFGQTDYASIYIVGRYMSGLLDLLTVLFVFGLGAVLYDRRVGLLGALFTAFTAFHIQQSHFFTVDAPLTCFVTLSLLGLALALRRHEWWPLVISGAGLGMALGSKVTVWLLVPVAVVAIVGAELRLAGPDRPERRARAWRVAAGKIALLGAISYVALRFAQPDMWAGPGWANVVGSSERYAQVTAGEWHAPELWFTLAEHMPGALQKYLLPDPRWMDSMTRIKTQVTGFGMDWPPNHQWWGRLGYVFPWRNMVVWGMGPALGLAAWLSWLAAGIAIWRGRRRHLLLWLWVTVYFGYTGIQWGKTMRYGLPIYPALAVMAGWGLIAWLDRARRVPDPAVREGEGTEAGARRIAAGVGARLTGVGAARVAAGAMAAVVVGTVLWGWMFSRLYTRHHSRVAGSHWVYHNLPTAVGVHIKDDPKALFAGPWLPAQAPGDLRTVRGIEWPLGAAWAGPMRVLLPDESWQQRWTGGSFGAKPDLWTPKRGNLDDVASLPRVTVDAVRLAYPNVGSASARTVRVVLSTGASLGADGAPISPLADGRVAAAPGPDATELRIPLGTPLELRLGQEVYAWVAVDGGELTCRPAVLAYETGWDDIVPEGMYGYGAYDDANTDWVDGLFGVTKLEMYGEDYADWLDQTIAQIATIDYWVSSSNRVYGAVAQLPMRYPATIAFYRNVLFGETLGWRHTRSVQSFPNLGPLRINDQGAEEAFHVYDHPQVDVFEPPRPFDANVLRAYLAPITATRHWVFPPVSENRIVRFLDALLGRIPVDRVARPAAEPAAPVAAASASPFHTVGDVMLSSARAQEQRAGGTWRAMFHPGSWINRYPLLAVVVWYAVLLVLGMAAFPLVAVALPNLPDRGWSVARTAGLLLTSYGAWLAASTGLATNTALLLAGAGCVVAALSAAAARWAGFGVRTWLRHNRDAVLTAEAVFLSIFLVFLAIRFGNPDLWHTSKGGEKPMDFAYLNATLRSVRFPPYDPWFAGSKLNYYYFGFVFVGALIKLTHIVPWVAYNLAIPTLAAMTGTGVFGIVSGWLGRSRVGLDRARRVGGLAAGMTVFMGNLYQAPWMTARMSELAPPLGNGWLARGLTWMERFPWAAGAARGVHAWLDRALGSLDGTALIGTAMRATRGLWAFAFDPAARNGIALDWWYWNASRAIPSVNGDVQPITEFPFFTFIYADLHAHMMAMPIAVLACAVALGWALPARDRGFATAVLRPDAVVRMALGALAIGALWPTNTWDFPTYGLIAAGAIAIGAYQRGRRLDAVWLGRVALTGGLLLGLSLALFLPYHLNYITPYSAFRPWIGFRTPASAYLTVHGIFLFALLSWGVAALATALRRRDEGRALRVRSVALGAVAVAVAVVLWRWSLSSFQADMPAEVPRPGLGTPLMVFGLIALGLAHVLRRFARPGARLLGWYLAVGALLTGFVEYVVLSGDIGRMNTVFKFYIHVWILWAIAAGVATGLFLEWQDARPRLAGRRAWRAAMGTLVACGLLYTVTAARAKILDRFPADRAIPAADLAALHRPGLSGMDYMAHAGYIEYDQNDAPQLLDLKADYDAIRWLQDNVTGTPIILEGTWPINYHWGSRISIYTGLPTVIGWDWHQKQQKAAILDDPVGNRVRDVDIVFNTTDEAEAIRLLDRYGVELIIVGQLERMRYTPEGLAKFARWAQAGASSGVEVIYATPNVTVYRRPYVAPADDPAPAGAAGGVP